MTWYAQAAKDSLAEVAVINLINLPIALGIGYYLSASAVAVFGFIVLLEATGLMFIGGAMDLSMSAGSAALAKLLKQRAEKGSDSEDQRRKRFRRAVVFTLAGVVLFAESLALALPYI
jgi:hypothetical protein